MKTLISYNSKAFLYLIVFLLFSLPAYAQEAQTNSGSGRLVPDFSRIPYSTEKHHILNIYIAKGTPDGPPTPLYVWAHGGGGSLDSFEPKLWNELSQSGISAISWGSIDTADSLEEYGVQSRLDFEKVMQFITRNADKYNFDINKIVVGGTSRGSFITWEFSHKNVNLVKGIYSTGALGDPAMWRDDVTYLTSQDPRNFIHRESPPLFFTYPAHLGDVNIHNPRSGLLIIESYDALGIGYRARVEHSLGNRNLNRWSFIVDFISEVTDEEFKKERALEGVEIGDQVWTAQNLNVGYFRNGDSIPQAKTAEAWEDAGAKGEPAWCYYNNDPLMGKLYGKLYNLPAVNDPRGLAPDGWEIPTEEQWSKLTEFLGGESVAGKQLKSTFGWENNGNGNNSTGFAALPGGNRNADGSFWFEGEYGYWWVTTGVGRRPGAIARTRVINFHGDAIQGDGGYGISGLSVRCIKK